MKISKYILDKMYYESHPFKLKYRNVASNLHLIFQVLTIELKLRPHYQLLG